MAVTVKVHPRVRPRKPADWLGVCRSDRTFSLQKSIRDELSDTANLNQPGRAFTRDRNAMLSEVEEAVSMYPDRVRTLDRQAARPVHKLKLLIPLLKWPSRRRSLEYSDWHERARVLAEWPAGPLAWDFWLVGFPKGLPGEPNEFQRVFLRYARKVFKRLSNEESRHGPTSRAKDIMIGEGGEIFDRYAFIENEAGREELKAEFVAMILTVIGFAKVDPEKLPYLRTSRLRRKLSNFKIHPKSKPWPRHRHSWGTFEDQGEIRVRRCLHCQVWDWVTRPRKRMHQ